eukprot:gb/GECG01016823.1/.p1 GENE.gb/GECG01016823.1/~~gb/GECG01016823.1/.p1  ORF type:complete len:436 (+),score=63.87 gb/GECG01016823.1/:1-1308(+)
MTAPTITDVDDAIEALMEESAAAVHRESESGTDTDAKEIVTRTISQYLYRVGVLDTSFLLSGEPQEMKFDGSCQTVPGGFTKEMIRSKTRHEVNVDSGDDHQEIYAFSFLPPLEEMAAGAPVQGNAYIDQLTRDNAFRNPKSYVNMLRAFGVEEHRSLLHGNLDDLSPKLPVASGGIDAENEGMSSVHTRQEPERTENPTNRWRYDTLYVLQSREWAQHRTQKARQALEQGYYKEALKCCDQALALEKDTIEAYLIKAEVYELRREIKESEQILSQALRLNENHQTARESLQRVQEKLRTLGLNAGRDLPNTSSSSQTEDRFPNVAAPESLDRGRLKDLLIQQMKEKHNYGGPSSVNSKDLLGDPSRPATSGASRHLDNHDGERRRSHSKRCGDKSSSSSSKDRKRHKSKRHKSSHGRRRSSSKHRERSSRGSSL